jgi:hypothetical protein
MVRAATLVSLLLGACAAAPPSPEHIACLARMEAHAAHLLPGFTALAYQPEYRLRLDEDLADGRGFPKGENILGDASPGGEIRLRPSRVCGDEVLARAVVAHEMAHVALRHRAVPGNGIIVLWEKPPLETAADELAHAALLRAGGDPRPAQLVACWLGRCNKPGFPGRGARGW